MRTIVITGASDGIGAAAAAQLSSPDTRLVLVGRNPERTAAVAARVGASHHLADFEHLDQVRTLAAELLASYDRIDVLANNAGGAFATRHITADGFERTFQVNHLAPFLLTHLLTDRLLASGGTVVNTSSRASGWGKVDLDDLDGARSFSENRAYGSGKLANIIHVRGLHERFRDQGLTAVAFHPGVIATSFGANSGGVMKLMTAWPLRNLLSTPDVGGARLAWCVSGTPDQDWRSGGYYDRPGHLAQPPAPARDPHIVREHWERSAAMLGLT